MDYTKAFQDGKDTVVTGIKNFDLTQTLDCGQCFRWVGQGWEYTGIAHGRQLRLIMSENNLILKDTSHDEFEYIWKGYFDLGRDYTKIRKLYSTDLSLAAATGFSPGLRVMRQDPWETLITFILSQNSNIPRIKKMIAQLCEHFGKHLPCGGYAFPTPEVLAKLTSEALAPVKTGYRAPYIIDAACQVAHGKIDLCALESLPAGEIQKALTNIHGVGPKVAECVLLYGYGKVERYPVDVWIKRVMDEMYPAGFPEAFASTAGIAQQYLFHYARTKK
ncbi:MAG: DNA-3-methyladenine glycosylase 2 family protein [Defluviitaleaceae bacterium]|nr:DNA-3-methyladenine glycosylase 2 family protein [Defluviitaleaceae bacterium]